MTAPPPPPRHRVAFWVGALLALAMIGGGTTLAVASAGHDPGPADTVRGYFAALAAADAPTALAFGDVPPGPRDLLTSTVLREQRRIAPITHLRIARTSQQDDRATVDVSYQVAFPTAAQRATGTIALHRSAGQWRLDAVAATTELHLPAASARATIAGLAVPQGDTLIFPGAVPVSFDTPLLELRPGTSTVRLDAAPTTLVFAQVSAAGRRAVVAAARASLDACFGPHASAAQRCPQPTERYVPGALRGTTTASLATDLSLDVLTDPTGRLAVRGHVRIDGSYRRLSFTNQVETGRGVIDVPVDGSAYPVLPIRISWARS